MHFGMRLCGASPLRLSFPTGLCERIPDYDRDEIGIYMRFLCWLRLQKKYLSFNNERSGNVPNAYANRDDGQFNVDRNDPRNRDSDNGFRSAEGNDNRCL